MCCRYESIPYKIRFTFKLVLIGQDNDLAYQFELCSAELCRLIVIWERKVWPIPDGEYLHWGPSEAEKRKCIEQEFAPSWEEDNTDSEATDDESEDEDWEDVNDDIEGDLLESMETMMLSEEYRGHDQDVLLYYGQEPASSADRHRRVSLSPRKRNRED